MGIYEVGVILFLASLILTAAAVISLAKSGLGSADKIMWVLIVLFFPIAGPIIYFSLAKKKIGSN